MYHPLNWYLPCRHFYFILKSMIFALILSLSRYPRIKSNPKTSVKFQSFALNFSKLIENLCCTVDSFIKRQFDIKGMPPGKKSLSMNGKKIKSIL